MKRNMHPLAMRAGAKQHKTDGATAGSPATVATATAATPATAATVTVEAANEETATAATGETATATATAATATAATAKTAEATALVAMLAKLRLARANDDPDEDLDRLGAVWWIGDTGKDCFCALDDMSFLITNDLVEDFDNPCYKHYTAKLGPVKDWPRDLKALARRIYFAADLAYSAGFDKIAADPTLRPKHHPPPTLPFGTPPAEMQDMVDAVNITRLASPGGGHFKSPRSEIGNVAWFNKERESTLVCCITSVFDLHDAGVLFCPDDKRHAEVAAEYGPLHLFPLRLRQLSRHLDDAAERAKAIGFYHLRYEDYDADPDYSISDDEGAVTAATAAATAASVCATAATARAATTASVARARRRAVGGRVTDEARFVFEACSEGLDFEEARLLFKARSEGGVARIATVAAAAAMEFKARSEGVARTATATSSARAAEGRAAALEAIAGAIDDPSITASDVVAVIDDVRVASASARAATASATARVAEVVRAERCVAADAAAETTAGAIDDPVATATHDARVGFARDTRAIHDARVSTARVAADAAAEAAAEAIDDLSGDE